MQGFSSSFLIFFYQIALGGLFALAGTPFHEIERAFYKSTAGVLYVIALLGLWGKSIFYWQSLSHHFSWSVGLEVFFHVAFIFFFSCYMVSLWGERRTFRARSFASSVLTGLAGLVFSAHGFYDGPFVAIETVGHWYLIDTGQSLDPFIRIYKFFVAVLLIQCLIFTLSLLALHFFGSPNSHAGIERLWQYHSSLLLTRVIVGQAAPLILAWLIWRTLLIPHTMAATGLFYIALLGVFVGEILGRQILALTSLPL